MARVVVDVMLKPEILDPQGKAVGYLCSLFGHLNRSMGRRTSMYDYKAAPKLRGLRSKFSPFGRLGLSGVTSVRQGKTFTVDLEGDLDDDLLAKVHELAGSLLSNPVIEDYVVREVIA